MEGRIKILLLLGLMLIVSAGCIGGTTTPPVTEGGSTPLNASGGQPPAQPPAAEQCTPSYTFSELPQTGTLGQVVQFSVTAACAQGKTIGLNIDGKQETGGQLSTNDPITFNFMLLPSVEGMKNLVVWSDNDVIYNQTWEVLPIGSADT
ncbi:hypothetical protein H0O02_00285, partial [Candidatus Micrarchaeota archaeon]|nr:hypothetical protein [Candidatus Micrarchaeota archaeon]